MHGMTCKAVPTHHSNHDRKTLRFIFDGGEPLLVAFRFYRTKYFRLLLASMKTVIEIWSFDSSEVTTDGSVVGLPTLTSLYLFIWRRIQPADVNAK